MNALMLTTDLLSASQAAAAAAAQGTEFVHLPSGAALLENFRQRSVDLIVVDIANCDTELAELVDRLRTADSPGPRIVAFGPHVHQARLAAARDAGCDEVLTRGQFHACMHELFCRQPLS
jgi:DNA-binding response OmpR family regulator